MFVPEVALQDMRPHTNLLPRAAHIQVVSVQANVLGGWAPSDLCAVIERAAFPDEGPLDQDRAIPDALSLAAGCTVELSEHPPDLFSLAPTSPLVPAINKQRYVVYSCYGWSRNPDRIDG